MVEHSDGTPMYLEDEIGFFRRDMYKLTGLKFRPLDVVKGVLTVDNSEIENARRDSRNFKASQASTPDANRQTF